MKQKFALAREVMQGSSAGVEAALVLNYAEDYIDFLENFANVLQPHLSIIRRLDGDYLDVLKRLNEVQTELESTDKEDRSTRKELLQQIKLLLAEGQQIGDQKLKEVAEVSRLKEAKMTQLDNNRRNFVSEPQKRNESSRIIRSNVSITGARPGYSAKEGGTYRQSTSVDEKRGSTSLERSSHARTDNGRGGDSERPDSASKRPRRAKQFPDFIRDVEYAERGNGGPAAGVYKKEKAGGRETPVPQPAVCSQGKKKRGGGRAKGAKESGKGKKAPVLFDTPIDPEEPVYCVCQQVSYGEMIGCDYSNCRIEWFHFSCVGLASKPKGKWFCPNCRGDRPNTLKSGLAGK